MSAAILAGKPSLSGTDEFPLAEQLIAVCGKIPPANPECGPAIRAAVASQRLIANRTSERIAPPLSLYGLGELYTLMTRRFDQWSDSKRSGGGRYRVGYKMSCVQRNRASVLPLSLATTVASQTWVVFPP